MTLGLTRRAILAGMLSATGGTALAKAPLASSRPVPRGQAPEPAAPAIAPLTPASEDLVRKANLSGEVGFAVADVESGVLLEARMPWVAFPPASTLKAITALYALDRLGPEFRFRTALLATGPVTGGRLDGDLVLVGGGDPTLDTDRMADLAVAMREAGLTEVRGRYLVWPHALPHGDRIDHDQPEFVSYNPAFGGLNLNYNRVHFEWKRTGGDYAVTMDARAARFSPSTDVASMAIDARKTPVFEYRAGANRDHWSVAERALGKNGARWLPVRFPAHYAGDVFRTLARVNGVVLPPAQIADVLPEGRVLASVESEALVPVIKDMLKYSTNLTAEIAGLTAGGAGGRMPDSLAASGARMAGWAMARFGVTHLGFHDHSGLGYDSQIAPGDMARILAASAGIAPLLKTVDLSRGNGAPGPREVLVRAKTGTLNFVSALAGLVTVPGGRDLSFAIFTADTVRRDGIPPEARENPPGAKGWAQRSRQLQRDLIRSWVDRLSAT